jgi:FdhE protein
VTTLDKLLGAHPELAPAAATLRALIAGMADVRVSLPSGAPNIDAARERLREGIPALAGEELIDADGLRRATHTIAGHLGGTDAEQPARTAMVMIDEALSGSDAPSIVLGALAGAADAIFDTLVPADPRADEQTVVTLLDYATRPSLHAGRTALRDVIAEAQWSRGSCPACGAPPLLAELRTPASGSERERYLRCGRCDSSWQHPRVSCPGCGTADHRALRYLHIEGEEEFRRAMTCDRCQGYIKEVAVHAPLEWKALLEEDLATVAVDLMAMERGYQRASA